MTTSDDLHAAEFQFTLPDGPYPGLRPFNADEWPVFFGRERMTDEVIARLVRDQFLVVHGDSGCGKSSLIRAGVLPRLEQESARGGLTWRTTITQPRNAPLELLAEALATLDGRAGDDDRIIEIRRILNFGDEAPPALAQLLRRGPTDYICVLIDQFEELFTFARHSSSAEAKLFVEILVALLEQPPQGLYSVVTMRSEFLGACAHYPGLAEAVNRAQYLLPRMSHGDLTRAVREPAELFGGAVTADLAERLITDSGGSQDQLPLIQHGLMQMSMVERANAPVGTSDRQLWQIELDDYLKNGDLSESLSNHADEILASVEPPPFPIAERLFRALTEINADGQAVRRPRTVRQLAAVCNTDIETLTTIVNAFRADGASFLTPFGSAPMGPDTLVDISHEALIRCWSRISAPSGWLTHEFQDGLIWRSLVVQADDFDKNPDHLLALATAEDQSEWLSQHNATWAERYGGGWDGVQRMVDISLTSGRAARQERKAAARRRQQYSVAFGVFLIMVAIGLALLNRRANQALARANQASAASLWNRLDFTSGDRFQDDELNALWEIRLADDAVRSSFFDQLTTLRDRVMRLSRQPEEVLRAVALRWEPTRAAFVRDAVLREALTANDAAALLVLAPAIEAVAPFVTSDQAVTTFERYLQTIRAARSATHPSEVSDALTALAGRIDQASAMTVLSATLERLASPPIADYIAPLGAASAALAERIPADQVNTTFDRTLAMIAGSRDANVMVALTPVAQALAHRLDETARGDRLIRVLSAIRSAQSVSAASALATVAADLAAQTTAPQATTALKVAIDGGLLTNDDPQIGTIASTLVSRADKNEALRLAAPLITRLTERRPGQRTGNLTMVVNQVLPNMATPDEQRRVLELFVRLLATASHATDANILAAAIASGLRQPDALGPSQMRQVVPALIAAAHYGDDDVSTDGFAGAADRAATTLTSADARTHLATVMKQMADSVAPGTLRALTALVPALTAHLSADDAATFLPQTWQAIDATVDANQLAAFSSLVPSLARRLQPEQARRSLPVCLRFLAGTRDPDQIGALAMAARHLAELLPSDEQPPALGSVQQALETEPDPDRLARLAPVLPLLTPGMTSAQADALFPRLIAAIESTLYASQLQTLQAAAEAVVARLSGGQVMPSLATVARSLGAANDVDRINALTATAYALGARPEGPKGGTLPALAAWAPTPAHVRAAIARIISEPSRAGATPATRVASLVNTLKYPTVTGDTVGALLTALHAVDGEAPGAAAGLDASLAFAMKKYPLMAIDAAPACPLPLLSSLSCPASGRASLFDLERAFELTPPVLPTGGLSLMLTSPATGRLGPMQR